MIKAYVAREPGGKLERFEFEPGPLGSDQVEIEVAYCGICYSDLSMLNNEWQMTSYPLVPGHEAAGRIAAIGSNVKHLRVGVSGCSGSAPGTGSPRSSRSFRCPG